MGARRRFPKTRRQRDVAARRRFPKTCWVKTRVVAKTRRHEDTWAREDTSQTGQAKTLMVAKARGRRIGRRQPQPREAVCFELQGSSFCCSRLYASPVQMLFTMAQLHDLIFPRCVHTRPRLETLAGFYPCPRARTHHVHSGTGNVLSQIQHLRGVAPSGVQTWRCSLTCGASCPRGVSEPVGIARRGVICPRGVKEPGCVARCGVKTWRHSPTWRQGAGCRRQMWRQNLASVTCGVKGPRGVHRCGVET